MVSLILPTKVLLIDDDEDDCIRVRNALTRFSPPRFTLKWVADFDAALAEMFLSHDVCLLDYRLGDWSGLDLLEKARREGCTIPIIFLTGRGGREIDLLAMKAGADDYLEKEQISSSLLERSIRYAINRREREEALKEARNELELRVRKRTAELAAANKAMESEIAERRMAEEALRESERKYRSIVNAFEGRIWLAARDHRVIMMNDFFIASLGYDATGQFCYRAFHNRDSVCPRCRSEVVFKGETARWEIQNPQDGRYFLKRATPVHCSDGTILKQVMSLDITERKLAEIKLEEREEELACKAVELEETNAALRILLKHREDGKKELEENIMYNMKQMVIPYIEKLKSTHLDDRQKMFLSLLESNANEIISPFVRNLFWTYSNLTPMELQVAGLVQEGKTGQDIADILSISENTVKFHKINLRKKLGLTDKKANLKSFLQSLKKA